MLNINRHSSPIRNLNKNQLLLSGKLALPSVTAAAYSLRLLNSNATKAIKVRTSATVTGDTTYTSPIIANSNTTTLFVGEYVSGTGIPNGATIVSIDSPTQFTMSANATATNAGITIALLRDIYFNGKSLDIATLMTWIGSNSGFVQTWYDQSGNGNHATQSTAANQPRIVNAGVLDVDSFNKPNLFFDGSNDYMLIPNNTSVDILSQPLMINTVFTALTGIADLTYVINKNLDSNAQRQYGLRYTTTNSKLVFLIEGDTTNAVAGSNNSVVVNTQSIHSGTWENNTMQMYSNSVNSGNTDTYSGNLTSRQYLVIGARSNTGGGFISYIKANISEIIINIKPSERQKIEKNQGSHYGITVV